MTLNRITLVKSDSYITDSKIDWFTGWTGQVFSKNSIFFKFKSLVGEANDY